MSEAEQTRWFLISGMLFFSLVIGIWALSSRRKLKRAGSWPVTKGIITRSDIVRVRGDNGVGDAIQLNKVYHLELRYRFKVGDLEYEGSDIRIYQLDSELIDPIKEQQRSYPVGKQVDVHYNPAKPRECLLDPQPGPMLIVLFGISIVFACVGVALFFVPFRS